MSLFKLFALSVLIHGWVAARLVPSLAAYPAGQVLLIGVLGASALLTPLGLTARRFAVPPLANRLSGAGLL